MGSGLSKTQQLEGQITRLHDSLVDRYSRIRNARISQGMINFLYVSFLILIIPFLSLRIYLNRHEPLLNLIATLSTNELFLISCGTVVWSSFSFWCELRSSRNMELIESERYQIMHAIEQYESHTNMRNIRSALQAAGHNTFAMSSLSLTAADFGAQTAVAPRNSIFTRIAEWIVGDGPDRCYALICPNCHHHNGLIDGAEVQKLQYRCPKCKCLVDAKQVIRRKEERRQIDLDNMDEQAIKEAENEDSDYDVDEPPPTLVE